MENFEYRLVGRLVDGDQWEWERTTSLQGAQARAAALQAAEDKLVQTGLLLAEDKLTYSIERRPIPPEPEWEPYNPTSGEES
ncbi:hypothetical protein [Microbacterium sp. p3-SID131]|uniref:hypothetical protein n=1 Tax=Microbacterium sp. p3-SID131 TaxID=2916215 RepID=UPI0021A66763|nr:hypothetical protein [Microbacterium sp. p3-SID131]MCT1363346.1 hypothetical protein [Microbacterium sp. p3-SID131]